MQTVILLHAMQSKRSCRGISFKTQLLYLVVFVTRYLDLFHFISLYNTAMKVFFIASSAYILYLMKFRYRPTHDPAIDTLRLEYLLGPCAVLALIFNYKFTPMEILWSFSIFLEAVAVLPQLFMLQRTGEAETITTHYLAALAAYRALYIPNWIYRYVMEETFDPIAVISGIVQTAVFSDFAWIYYNKVLHGQKFELFESEQDPCRAGSRHDSLAASLVPTPSSSPLYAERVPNRVLTNELRNCKSIDSETRRT
ncbi:uncharacterized protein L969DRAFT_95852 [Mixia osmundae IAM 14324]|uniref:ER lumen protein-retaining receptor n=1 Tax=Mixia osmundae (strain CBS 9802 / IAM 14324 / JCM 22182 / KY 12970) TaxID=764103 RepID=G7DSD5_MIXOS|nr:uncharacterized protein L969DRAFT_95852 [Mixia osmundae IAM 14324]KEI38010.1 hypothetical protein L969DRAFT_95852 [Mixia osmundae IAM 14324]GAA93495.1 hypothetical protein E5Q_00136 [Mixia osmundae IAM 14324]